MEAPPRKLTWSVWAGLLLTLALLGLAFVLSKLSARPAAAGRLPVYAQVTPFSLTNQLAQPITLATLRGHVWIADIIFTRCPGPCLRMTRQMAELQAQLPSDPRLKLISLTTDPDFDTPEVLRRYGEKIGVRSEQWWFLTGAKPELARLAVDGLKFTAVEKKPEERENPADLFIHSTIFALVDKHGRLRGVFETQPAQEADSDVPPDSEKQWKANKARILAAVGRLLAEE